MAKTNTLVKIKDSVKFTPVKSTMVESYAREAGDLAVKFNSGSTYIYKGVDEATFQEFLKAPSVGKFIASKIKPKFTAELAE